MLAKIYSAAVYGVDAYEVEIEVNPAEANDLTSFFAMHKNYDVDFSDVKVQGHVKRAIEVAVAGGHNLLIL
jgi:magnesium chelatase family protein